MAAMDPDAPGRGREAAAPPGPAVPLPFPRLVVDVVVEAEDEAPQAARVTAATPRTDQARARRTVNPRLVRRSRWSDR